jgi:DNA repair protein SbcD/Mre11
VKIVHAADLHIDSPLRGLERYEGAPFERVRGATREAFRNVVSVCLREQARFLVLAGDVFDGDWKDMNTGMFFVKELRRLHETGCEVLLLRGNHDFELTRALKWPEHVHEFGGPRTGKRSYVFEGDGVAFHGVSYATQKVVDSLLPEYPAPLGGGLLEVGVLHTNATASSEHAAYAPCTVSELTAHGYGYWALGHVHGHAVLARDPWVVYPGNTQGRNARETGPKGCVVLDCAGGAVRDVRFVETDVMRWVQQEITLERDDGRDELIDRVRSSLRALAGEHLTAVRLKVSGGCRAHTDVCRDYQQLIAQLRTDALETGLDLWLEKIELATSPATSIDELRSAQGLVADLLRNVEQIRTDEGDAELHLLARALDPLRKKLGKEIDGLHLEDPEVLRRLLAGAEALLAQRLTEGSPE